METINLIRKHIATLAEQSLFTTREFLCYGKRSAVDNALSLMVKRGEINRVIRGVFASPKRTKPVTVLEIATVKAHSFGRRIIMHAANIAAKLGLFPASDSGNWFATDGKTSSFRFGSIVIHFKGVSLRKMAMGDSPAGQAIRALCYLGKNSFSENLAKLATHTLKEAERTESGRLCALMPAWLSGFFHTWYQPDKQTAANRKITDYHSSEQRSKHGYKSGDSSVNEAVSVYLESVYSNKLIAASIIGT